MALVRSEDMAFSEFLAARIRDALARKKNVEAKRMFGGIVFLLHGNMLVGIWKDSLIVRVGPQEARRRFWSRTSKRSTSLARR
jgi:TfoX/Sxy family transcriptional regulator of competence genes